MKITWLNFFDEMLSKVLAEYDKTTLVNLTFEIFGSNNFNDKFKDGTEGPIREIDPLTFIGFFNRNQTEANRIQLCETAKLKLGLKGDVPKDFSGIPIINPQKSWFFPFEKQRGRSDVDHLWDFAKKLNNSNLDNAAFQECLAVLNVGVAKLTQVAFIVKPDTFFPLDQFSLDFLIKSGVVTDTALTKKFNFAEYQRVLKKIKEIFPDKSFAQLSHDAKMNSDSTPQYWVVGAMWGDNNDKSAEFIRDGEWVNGYDEKNEKQYAEKAIEKVHKVKHGDWIAIKSIWGSLGIRIKAVGKVVENAGDGRHLKVQWNFKGPPFDIKGVYALQTIHEIKDEEEIKLIFNSAYKSGENKNSQNKTNKLSEETAMTPKNLILYGPPGTGKTYNSINKAIEIINPSFDLNSSREKIKTEFDRLVKEGQVVFTTFHQGLSYEDFIEGIKPSESDKDGALSYSVELGIFRKLCVEAAFAVAQTKEIKITEDVLGFSIAYDRFIEDVESKLEKGERFELKTKTGNIVYIESVTDQGNLLLKHTGGERSYTVSKNRLTKLQSGISDINQIDNINDKFREIIGGSNSSAYWAVLNYLKSSNSSNLSRKDHLIDFKVKKEVVDALTINDFKNAHGKPFVLIIDEINRGNVSQIFGELITLLEEDKRLGQPEALEVTLPYSRDKFGVPSNIFIVGTMNTADRSVEALDVALRRRFAFEEMTPKPTSLENKKINGINLGEILSTINKRLEKLLDKDHLIGHSYFIHVDSIQSLKQSLQKSVFPLLQEYFYGDIGKAGLIVGDGFLEAANDTDEDIFAKFTDYDSTDWNGKKGYRFKNPIMMSDIEFNGSLAKLLNK